MKTHSKAITVILIINIAFSVCFSVYAASFSVSITSDKRNVNIGDTVSINCVIRSDIGINRLNLSVYYDDSVLKYVSGGESNLNSTVFISKNLNREKYINFSVTFVSIGAGTADFMFGGSANSDGETFLISEGYTINVSENNYSGETSGTVYEGKSYGGANLLNIKVSGATLVPSFNENITSYTANVKYNVDKATLSFDAEGGAVVTGGGTFSLNVGDNLHTLAVKSANGKTTKVYNVNIHRLSAAETEIYEKTQNLADPLNVSVDNKSYLIAADITPFGSFEGYTAEKTLRKDIEVTYLKDISGKYKLYYLTDDSGFGRYFNQTKTGDFEEIPYIILNGNLYIVNAIPNNIYLGEVYVKKNIRIDGISVPALSHTQKSAKDIYIIYCYFDGEMCYYRYDSTEKTLSRAPEFAEQNYNNFTKAKQDKSIINRFKNLTPYGKAVTLLVVITAAALTVFVCISPVKTIKQKIKKREGKTEPREDLEDIEIIEQNTNENSFEAIEEIEIF